MAYQLLFSRNRTNNAPVVFSDIEITEPSVMIDAISILSQFRRVLGWVYPCRPTGTGSFERGEGRILPYGKNRCIFNDFSTPYFLEFFPVFASTNYILSVYLGEPDGPVVHDWVQYPSSGREFKLFPGTGISTREFPSGQSEFEAAQGAVEGVIYQNYLYWRMPDMTYFRREIGTWNPVFLVDLAQWSTAMSAPSALVL